MAPLKDSTGLQPHNWSEADSEGPGPWYADERVGADAQFPLIDFWPSSDETLVYIGKKDKDGNIWNGTTKITFGTKHKDVVWKECADASYIKWVADKSAVDWQRDQATCELKRRGLRK